MPNTRRTAFLVTLVLGGALAVVATWPQGIGAQRLPGVSQLIPFRGLLALGFGVLAIVVALIAAWRRRWGVAAGLAIALAAASLGNGAVLLARGGGAPAAEGDLVVVAWNTYGGGASVESVVRLLRETGADVASLPETDAVAAEEVVGILARDGIRMTAVTLEAAPGDDPVPTSLLVADSLGP